MPETMYDLAVLGGGPAGYAAALRASHLGGRVLLVERDALGGTCLNRGCIPTKTLIHGASVFTAVAHAVEWGVSAGSPAMDMAVLQAKKASVLGGLGQGIATLLKKAKVDVIHATGRVTAPQTVTATPADGETATHKARNILLALGSAPSVPPIPGMDLPGVMTSDALLEETNIPASLVVIGAGVIGLEFAGLYAALGTKVLVVEAMERILPMVDAELVKRLLPIWKRQGVTIERGAMVKAIEPAEGGLAVRYASKSGESLAACEAVLVAVGRRPLRLEGVVDLPDLKMSGPFVAVDKGMRTSVPGVFAAGDLVPGPMLAHAALAEGHVAASNAMGDDESMDYDVIPGCIYSAPEIAGVGLTEDQARERGLDVAVGKCPLNVNGRAQTLGEPLGMIKLIADGKGGPLVGAHLFGAQASELVAEAALAIRHGLSARKLARTIHSHPSLSEALAEAAQALLGEALHTA